MTANHQAVWAQSWVRRGRRHSFLGRSSILRWRCSEVASELLGQVLAGGKTGGEGDVRHASGRVAPEQLRRPLETTECQVLHRRHVGEFLAMPTELCTPETT